MAEKSYRVRDDGAGDFIATRDAYEDDDQANARVVQLVDIASRQLTYSCIRGNYGAEPKDTIFDLTKLTPDLLDNLFEVGDRTTMVVAVEQMADLGAASIVPLLFDDSDECIGMLEEKTTTITADAQFENGRDRYESPIMVWDVAGAYQIGMYISNLTVAGNKAVVKVGLI